MLKSRWSNIIGGILLIIGFISLFVGGFEYPIWKRNSETLQLNEALGHFTSAHKNLVDFQFSIVFFGITFGIICIVVGFLCLSKSASDKLNQIISRLEIGRKADLCPRCKQYVERSWIRCPNCQSPLKMVCSNCKRRIKFSWSACPYCGTILEDVKKD